MLEFRMAKQLVVLDQITLIQICRGGVESAGCIAIALGSGLAFGREGIIIYYVGSTAISGNFFVFYNQLVVQGL